MRVVAMWKIRRRWKGEIPKMWNQQDAIVFRQGSEGAGENDDPKTSGQYATTKYKINRKGTDFVEKLIIFGFGMENLVPLGYPASVRKSDMRIRKKLSRKVWARGLSLSTWHIYVNNHYTFPMN